MKYRKKPVVIEAFRYAMDSRPDWFDTKVTSNEIITYVGTDIRDSSQYYCEIKTLEGIMRGNCGDYIIKGVQGEVYPCKPDIFEMTYELASTSSQTEISDESWEGCDGCTEQDKYFWTKGYQAGYNRATHTEISDDRTKLHWKTSLVVHTPEISDEEIEKGAENAWSDYEYEEGNLYSTTFKGGWKLAIKWYREQLKQRQ